MDFHPNNCGSATCLRVAACEPDFGTGVVSSGPLLWELKELVVITLYTLDAGLCRRLQPWRMVTWWCSREKYFKYESHKVLV